ncbi:Proteasome subunit beta type-7 [Podila verticillata]|nr:Proteasome subunit beta type-7 [Podila verticillata]KAF9386756.1 Proteasome subunit beta type-7 [Podila verticillata]KAI9237665.1 MAG: nucleophile aminohydrolase [Podila humilis]KFH65137.1 20S proteasome subunit beta 7 [Podila verticillata NRRL 6337]
MDHFPTNWGNPRSEDVDSYNTYPVASHVGNVPHSVRQIAGYGHTNGHPTSHTQSPVVTGTSVLGIKYKGGVMMAADNLASYGSLARFRDIERLHKVTDSTVLGASGDMSDFQYVKHLLDSQMIKEYNANDGHTLATHNIYEYLWRVMYNRRSKMNPLWNTFVLGGVNKGESFLGAIDLKGTPYQAASIATGFGSHLAQPILRKELEQRGGEDNITEEQAVEILKKCMKVLWYRDARSMNKFQLAKITSEGVTISESMSVETEWGFAENIRGYGA